MKTLLKETKNGPDPEGWVAEIKEAVSANGRAAEAAFTKVGARLDDLEARMNRPGGPNSGSSSYDPKAAESKKAFRQWLRSGDDREMKAMSVGDDPQGGYAVVPVLAAEIMTVMRDIDPVRDYARVVPITKGDAFEEVQDQAGTSEASWVSETGTRGDTSNASIQKFRVATHEIAAQPKATQQLLDDSHYDIESWLVQKVGKQFAETIGAAFVTGDGVGKPRGFTTHPSAATPDTSRAWGTFEHVVTGTNASLGVGTAACNKLIDLVYTLKPFYRRTAAWFMSKTMAGNIRKLTDGAGRFVWTDAIVKDQPATLMGYPVVEMESLGTGGTGSLAIWFGAMNPGYTVVDRVPLRVMRDPYTGKPYVKFYTTFRSGGDVSDFHALKTLKFST